MIKVICVKRILYTEWNFYNQKGSSKNSNLMKNKKYEKNLLDDDKIEIDFFSDTQKNIERINQNYFRVEINASKSKGC